MDVEKHGFIYERVSSWVSKLVVECGLEGENTIKDDTGDSGLCNRLTNDIHWNKRERRRNTGEEK